VVKDGMEGDGNRLPVLAVIGVSMAGLMMVILHGFG